MKWWEGVREFTRLLIKNYSGKRHHSTQWLSMVCAASEEWVDETAFEFVPVLKSGKSVPELAEVIAVEVREAYPELVAALAAGRRIFPDYYASESMVAKDFGLSLLEAGRAIDRALGGVCRAATGWPGACPDPVIDPVAAAAFDLALADPTLIDAVYPGWREWEPGVHSPAGGLLANPSTAKPGDDSLSAR